VNWVMIAFSLPTESTTVGMRIGRALKTAGAASLRDGVYLLPDQAGHYKKLSQVADEVLKAGGEAHVFRTSDSVSNDFSLLFDRSQDYEALIFDVSNLPSQLPGSVLRTIKEVHKLRNRYLRISQIDFFPGALQEQADSALRVLETTVNEALSASVKT